MNDKQNLSFEELLAQLDESVAKLESKDLSLEEAIDTYKKGLELSQECMAKLENAKSVIVTKMEDK